MTVTLLQCAKGIVSHLPPVIKVSLTAVLRACFFGAFLAPTVIRRVPLETDSEIEIYVQVFYWGVFLGPTLVKTLECAKGGV